MKYSQYFGSRDVFISKINATGSAFIYSTYLGGHATDEGNSIAVDAAGNAYITGKTHAPDFPLVKPLREELGQGGDAFVSIIKSDGSELLFSSLLGGSSGDVGSSIALDGAGNIYVTGVTDSPDFPTKNAQQSVIGGKNDAFITMLKGDGSSIIYSTFLGGSDEENDQGSHYPRGRIAVDSDGNAYVTGTTRSANFPTVNPLQPSLKGYTVAFVAKIDAIAPTLKVSAIKPKKGGNTGYVTSTIYGSAFMPGATVKLSRSGQPDIVANPVVVNEGGITLKATFDLRSKALGLWDVVVTNPDGVSKTLPQAFQIEMGIYARGYASVIGASTLRMGQKSATYYVNYGNAGNTNALIPITITLVLDTNSTYTLGFPTYGGPLEQYDEQYDFSVFPGEYKNPIPGDPNDPNDDKVEIGIPLLISMAPGDGGVLPNPSCHLLR